MKGGVSAIHSLHCSFGWHLHSVPLHLIWSLTVRSLPLAASRNSQLSCLPHIWLAYNYAHSILHCIKMMSSWLPANLFKSAPAQKKLGRGGRAEGGGGEGESRGRGERVEATGWGSGSPTPCPSIRPTSPPQGGGGPGCAQCTHISACCSPSRCELPVVVWHAPATQAFSALAFMKYIYTL